MNIKNYEKEINSLKDLRKAKGASAAMYKLKEKVLKENTPDAMAIEDPESGLLLTDPESIKEVTLNYCFDLLSDRKPKPEYEEKYNRKIELHNARMVEKVDGDKEDLESHQFEEALKTVNKKYSNKYHFILKAGNSLKKCTFLPVLPSLEI